jgi:uncharacterized membrane protein YczE
MDTEIYEVHKGTIVRKTLPPLDVRIVVYYLYSFGFLEFGLSLLLGIGVAKPVGDAPWRVLLTTVVLTSNLAQGVYTFSMSCITLSCAWGLKRRMKFAWWLALIYHVYLAIDGVFVFAKYPVNTAIGVAMTAVVIVWLWLRRELYGVHLAGKSRRKSNGT